MIVQKIVKPSFNIHSCIYLGVISCTQANMHIMLYRLPGFRRISIYRTELNQSH